MKGGIEKLCEQVGQLASSYTAMSFENWRYGVDSPIEALMLVGMLQLVPLQEIDIAPIWEVEILTDNPHPDVSARIAKRGCMAIQMQHELLDWPADFVISCPSISPKQVIIECDGHDFHERTKEQARRDRSRDRAAQEAGYMMLRYTGSEIYRDPLGCAKSAIKALAGFIEDDWLKDIG